MAGPVPVTARSGNPANAPLALVSAVVALFFIWGGLTSLNDVLIPKLKGLFALSYAEAMLTQFAFFMAYFLISLPAGNLIARVGYLKGIVIGLGTMALGCLLFIPAWGRHLCNLPRGAVCAGGGHHRAAGRSQPVIANMGSAATAPSRLTLAQAFNSLGTTVFPPIGGAIILGSMVGNIDPANLSGAQRTVFLATESAVIGKAYFGIAAILIVVAAYFWWRRAQLPTNRERAPSFSSSFWLLRQPRLGGGVVSIFLYVGAEVSIGSMMINYLAQPHIIGVTEQSAAKLLAFYWGGNGRSFHRLMDLEQILAGHCSGSRLLRCGSVGNTFGRQQRRILGLCAACGRPDEFDHVPNDLFSRRRGFGAFGTPQGSGLLCMGIVGGALIPLLFGVVADATSLATALVVPVVCYLLIAFYGWRSSSPRSAKHESA